MKAVLFAAVFGLGLGGAAQAATVLDFEALGGTSDSLLAGPLTVGEYRFLGNGGGFDYAVRGTESPNYPGSAALLAIPDETHVFSRTDGGAFNLLSLDFSESLPTSASGSIQFTGTLAGGGTVNQTLTSDGVFGFESVTLSGFTNIVSVSFRPTSNDDAFQYDNIAVSAVPLPGAVGFALAALGALIVVRRRRA